MRSETIHRQLTIIAETAAEYDEKMNDILSRAPGATIIDRMTDDRFCSVIRYTKTYQIPETVEDEYYLQGKKFYCIDCKHFIPPTDKRRRDGECKSGEKRSLSAHACEYFYEQLKAGRDVLKHKTPLEVKDDQRLEAKGQRKIPSKTKA